MIQINSKKSLLLMIVYQTREREKCMIEEEKKLPSKVEEVEVMGMVISSPRCLEVEWVVDENKDQRKENQSNTPLRSPLKRSTKEKPPKLQ